MKILIIGSEGFIGSNCVGYFSNKNYTIYGIDLIDLPSSNYQYKKVFPQETKHENLFKDIQPDVCIYASGSANVNLSIQNTISDFEANSVYIFHILNSIKVFSPKCKFINISSAAVYGNPSVLPIKETSDINPISPYGWHKYYSELICQEFATLFGIRSCSIRPFSVFGPRQKKLLFWDIYTKTKNTVIELYGTGNESRDFIYIDDLCSAIECIIFNAEMNGDIYNIGIGKQVTIKDASELFINTLNIDKKITFNNVIKIGDPLNWEADISSIKKIGFSPNYSLESGLKKYSIWLKENV